MPTISKPETKASRRQSRSVLDPKDQVRSVKKLLDSILLEGQELSTEIRQPLIAARAAAWNEYKQREERIIAQTK